jgi:hypothetical protein
MHTSNPHSHNTILTSVVLGAVLALVFMSATVTGAYAANNIPATAFDAFTGTGSGVGSLVVPLANPPASALTRIYQSSFGSFSFGDPQALTVDQATGDVYAVSPSAGTVSRYTSAGAPDDFTAGPDSATNTLTGFSFDGPSAAEVAIAPAGAVGGTAGDIYVASFAGIDVYAGDGTHLGQITQANGAGFEEACGVATDNTGKVYVGDYGAKVDRYVPSANPATNTDYDAQITGVSTPCNVAADSTGAVYASTWSTGPLTKYPATDFGTSNTGILVDASSRAVSVDPSTNDVYVDEGEKIAVFDSTGTALYTFGSSADFGTSSAGVAVMGYGGNAYVADAANKQIDVYGPAAAVPPTATTAAASDIHHTKATLNGHLDPNGGAEITDCHFDWGTTNTYGNTTSCTQGNSYSAPADVSATVTGLEPGKTYHYRLNISTGTSTATGTDQTVETSALLVRRDLLNTIGQDGKSATHFSKLRALAFRPSTSSLYALDTNGIYGFDASAPPAYTPLTGFSPLTTAADGDEPGLAVDATGLSSAGNLYLASEALGKIYGFDATGAPLGGSFPIDVASTPGAPAGSPTDICGAAVDSTGQLWVSNFATKRILRYNSTGIFQGALDLSPQELNPCALAFDSNDDLYVSSGNGSLSQPTWRYTASSGYSAATLIDSHGGAGLAFNPTDHHLFIASRDGVREYDDAGNFVAAFAENVPGASYRGIAVDPGTDHVFLLDLGNDTIGVYGPSVIPPEISIVAASAITNTTTTINGSVDPQGFALSNCHFEYASETDFLTKGFTGATVAPCNPAAGTIPADLEDHTVSAGITGLDRNTTYRYRLVATSSQGTSVTSDVAFTTTGPAEVETVGSPIRTSTTARLEGRVDPRSAPMTYHFEYGDQGPCDSNSCVSTPPQPAGNGDTIEFVSQQITGLKANTTYHYRLLADNGNVDGPAAGSDRTLTTRASDAPLSHGHFPGPPGSDRAWEQVNIPDTGGSQVQGSQAIADSGERVAYRIDGGSPGSQYGGGLSANNVQYAERTPSGWQNKSLYPVRAQAPGTSWREPLGRSDLSQMYTVNLDPLNVQPTEIWRVSPGAPAQLVLSVPHSQYPFAPGFMVVSADGSRVLAVLMGNFDPAHPVGPTDENLYDVTTGTPHMVGLLPDGSVPSCGVKDNYMDFGLMSAAQGWVTPDGSHAFFSSFLGAPCEGEKALFVRDLVSSTTVQIAAHAKFISGDAGAAFFTTEDSLVVGDKGGNDIYRYTIQDGSLDCLTCSTAAAGSVSSGYEITGFDSVAVSDDGTRVYFNSAHRLLPGAAEQGIYRLDVSNRSLVYVAPAQGTYSGGYGRFGNAINPDGSVFVFWSGNPALNAVNGAQNGGGGQYYRYDDTDRSLVCVSCPGDGSLPRGPVNQSLEGPLDGEPGSALTSDGNLVFVTPTPLVSTDQNTALPSQNPLVGDDVYEWRDGRLLLVTDGQTLNTAPPQFAGASRSGRDVFFTQAARLTPDAIDAQRRLYDARIGGGFDFPQPPVPCSLEACQGNPSAPPNDQTPGSATFSGPGNQTNAQAPLKQCAGGKCVKSQSHKRCAKGKVLKQGKCVKKRKPAKRRLKRAKRANHNQRGAK